LLKEAAIEESDKISKFESSKEEDNEFDERMLDKDVKSIAQINMESEIANINLINLIRDKHQSVE
jgi:hypothetical protein